MPLNLISHPSPLYESGRGKKRERKTLRKLFCARSRQDKYLAHSFYPSLSSHFPSMFSISDISGRKRDEDPEVQARFSIPLSCLKSNFIHYMKGLCCSRTIWRPMMMTRAISVCVFESFVSISPWKMAAYFRRCGSECPGERTREGKTTTDCEFAGLARFIPRERGSNDCHRGRDRLIFPAPR